MLEMLEKAVMTTIGVAAITQKKAEELVKELKEKYKLSEEEGKAFLEKMQNMAKEGREKLQETAEVEVKKALDRMGLVSKEEFDKLLKRVEELETKVKGA